MKIKNIIAFTLPCTLALAFSMQGCVSRSAYEENMQVMSERLRAEKTANASAVKSLETRVQERGKTLSELTARYMQLKEDKDSAQAKLDRLQNDFEALLKDMAELKLVIFTNVKGSASNEMMMKINNMQNRVQKLINKEPAATLTPVQAVTPSAPPAP
ncbi:MAG: hypothetical protein HY954_07035 [Deltaproteobacteria bacterium]|nr:hypothetical protein [Deltaproteobacteria bacterium]